MRHIICTLYLAFFAIANAAWSAESDKILEYLLPQGVSQEAVYTQDGEPFYFGPSESKLRVVNLWATWCVSCRKEMPALDALSEQFNPLDLQIITVAVGKNDPQKIHELFSKTGVTHLSVYYDESKRFAASVFAPSLPYTLILDRSGAPIARLIGETDYLDPSIKVKLTQMIISHR